MLSVEYSRTQPDSGERAAYAVAIGGRGVARIVRSDRHWRLEYAGFTITLASLAAAKALVERYADKIYAGRALDLHEPT